MGHACSASERIRDRQRIEVFEERLRVCMPHGEKRSAHLGQLGK